MTTRRRVLGRRPRRSPVGSGVGLARRRSGERAARPRRRAAPRPRAAGRLAARSRRLRGRRGAAAGRSVNLVRSPSRRARAIPSMRSASSRAIASPSPEPPARVAGVEALEDALAARGRDAGPSSLTSRLAHPSLVRVADRDRGSLRGVGERIVDQDTQDLRDPIRVGLGGHGLVGGDLDRRPAGPGGGLELGGDARARGAPSVDALAPDLDRVGVEPARGRAGRRSASPGDRPARASCRRNSARVSGSGSSSSSSSTKPPRDEIGVRSSCEALAMNSRAGVVESRQPPLHLVEADRELADLVAGVDRDRGREVTVGDLLRRPLEPPQPPRVGARDEPAGAERGEQRDRAGDQDLPPDQGDVVLHLLERGREDGDPACRAPGRKRDRGHRRGAHRPRRSTALATPPAVGDRLDGAGRRSPRAPARRGSPRSPSAATRPASRREQGHPRAGAALDPARKRRGSLAGARRAARRGQAVALGDGRPLEPAQLLGGQARAQLRDDVEVDEPDRRRGDREEEQQPGAGALTAPLIQLDRAKR